VVAGALGDHLLVRLEHVADDDDARDITITGVGSTWANRWSQVEAAVGSC
jgi:hypothetical protein